MKLSLGCDQPLLKDSQKALDICIVIRTLCFVGFLVLAHNTLANHEDDHFTDKIYSFNGFATFAGAKPLTTGDERSINDFLQEDDEVDLKNHNTLGMRLTANLDDKLTLTAQMVSKGVNDYDADFDWIYAEYAFSSQWHIAIGRIRTPLFMYSEFVDVGYAYQWVQAPTEIYNLVDYPFQSMESVRLRYNITLNGWDNEFLAWIGSSADPLYTNGIDAELELKEAWGVAFTTSHDWLTLRSVYFTGLTSADLSSIDVLGQPNHQFTHDNGTPLFINNEGGQQTYFNELNRLNRLTKNDISKDIIWENDRGEYLSIGLALNFEYIFVNAEVTQATVDNALIIPKVLAGYLMIGYQINPSWSISYTYGRDKNSVNEAPWRNITRSPTNNTAQLAQDLAIFEQITQESGIYFQEAENQSDKVNIRFDFHAKAAVKFEYWQEDQQTPSRDNHPKGIRLGLDLIF